MISREECTVPPCARKASMCGVSRLRIKTVGRDSTRSALCVEARVNADIQQCIRKAHNLLYLIWDVRRFRCGRGFAVRFRTFHAASIWLT